MQSGGKTREYMLAVPVDYDASKSYPLVMEFHGDGGNGPGMQQGYPFEAVSKREAIVVYPSGLYSTWDIYGAPDQNADQPFVRALVDEVASKYNIDKSRVLGTGYSSGGFLVNQMACRYQGLFRAIAPHAGGAPNEDALGGPKDGQGFLICPGGPTATFVFHGDADWTVDLESGKWAAYFWSHVNGCQEPGTGDTMPTSAIAPSPCKQYDNCAAGKPVTICVFPGVGHVVAQPAPKIAWDYFKALP